MCLEPVVMLLKVHFHQLLLSYWLQYVMCSRERQQCYGAKVTVEQINCNQTLTNLLYVHNY